MGNIDLTIHHGECHRDETQQRIGQKGAEGTFGMTDVEYYSGHRNGSYPVRILKNGVWRDVLILRSAIVEDQNGKRIRRFRCRIGDEIINIEKEE